MQQADRATRHVMHSNLLTNGVLLKWIFILVVKKEKGIQAVIEAEEPLLDGAFDRNAKRKSV